MGTGSTGATFGSADRAADAAADAEASHRWLEVLDRGADRRRPSHSYRLLISTISTSWMAQPFAASEPIPAPIKRGDIEVA
jgi:hypothetical protein